MNEYIPGAQDLIDAYAYTRGIAEAEYRRETARKILEQHDREVAARALREFRKHVEERRDGASTQLISDCASFTIGAIDGYLIRQQIERGAGE